jgi:hypothetical protein
MKRCFLPAALALSGALLGCASGTTRYSPVLLARGELVLSYEEGLYISAAGQPVARGSRYDGLSSFVRCVPNAHRHAEAAEAAGTQAFAFSVTGVGLSITGLGGLAGLAFTDNQTVMLALLGSGIGVEVLGLVFAALGRASKISAMGHAVDAVNYYNDAVGSVGGSCSDAPAPPSPASPPPDPGGPSGPSAD